MSEGAEPSHYLRMVEHNLDVLRLLSESARRASPPTDVSDWKCTLIFYMACIYIKALGKLRHKDLQDHYELRQWLNSIPDLMGIARPYRKLEERSRAARYDGRRFTPVEMSEALQWFYTVRNALTSLLKAGGVSSIPSVDPSPHLT